jgi:hypothetical protein
MCWIQIYPEISLNNTDVLETCAHPVAGCNISHFHAASVTLRTQEMSSCCVSILRETVACHITWHRYIVDVHAGSDTISTETYHTHCIMCIVPATDGGCGTLSVVCDHFLVCVTIKT